MDNQLEVMLKDSNIETTKAQYILEKFKDYFDIAAIWETRAKSLVVTSDSQLETMEAAKIGRKFFAEKRIAVEKARKAMKEESLREGQAIDGIAKTLKALIIPIEKYLEQQEKFAEIQDEKKRAAKRAEIEKRMEEERVAEEKKAAEEQERIRLENIKLKEEAVKRDKEALAEREEQEKTLAKERAKREAEREASDKIRIEQENKLVAERIKVAAEKKVIRDKQEKELEAQRAKARENARIADEKAKIAFKKSEAEKAKACAKVEAEREAAHALADVQRKEKERLAEILKNQIECPNCKHKFQIQKKG